MVELNLYIYLNRKQTLLWLIKPSVQPWISVIRVTFVQLLIKTALPLLGP